MEKILVLGTGDAITLNCFNTCFILENNGKYLLVDTGGGSQVINQIQKVGVDISDIHDVFISHKHIDHLLGIFYVLRMVCYKKSKQEYMGKLNIYCAKEVKEIVEKFVLDTFSKKYDEIFQENVIFHEIENEQEYLVIDYPMKILDLYPKENLTQYGFQIKLNSGKIFTFLGDIPCSEKLYDKIRNTDWVCHEAFCQETEKEIYNPHQHNHSTVKDVAENMRNLEIKNLILWHTRDNNLANRKELYTQEAKEYFAGNVYVPDDLEEIIL